MRLCPAAVKKKVSTKARIQVPAPGQGTATAQIPPDQRQSPGARASPTDGEFSPWFQHGFEPPSCWQQGMVEWAREEGRNKAGGRVGLTEVSGVLPCSWRNEALEGYHSRAQRIKETCTAFPHKTVLATDSWPRISAIVDSSQVFCQASG